MATIKYYWPERKSGARTTLVKAMDEAEAKVEGAQRRVDEFTVALERLKEELHLYKQQFDESRLALIALEAFDAEEMYHVDA